MSYKNLLFRFTEMSKDIFGNNLTGIYLHGYHGLIDEALICYQTDRKMEAATKVAKEYAEYMICEIEERKVMLETCDQ